MSNVADWVKAILIALGLLGGALPAKAAIAETPEAAAAEYFRAESQFDVAALESILDLGFVEISASGEIDERDKVLSFYSAGQSYSVPTYRIGPMRTRLHGDIAVMTTTLTYVVGESTRRMTVGISALRVRSEWRLLSAQYTVLRSVTTAK